jgi:hypothetical protein
VEYPRRLVESVHDDFELSVLRSAELDQPPPAVFTTTARLLGLSAAMVGTWSGTAAAGAGAASSVTGAAVAGAAKWGGLFVAKYIGIGLAGGVVVLGAVGGVTSVLHGPTSAPDPSSAPMPSIRSREGAPATRAPHTPAPQAPTDTARVAPATSGRATARARTAFSPDALASTDPLTQAPAEPPVVGFELAEEALANARPSTGDRSLSLAQEVALLDQARHAVRQRSPGQALLQLDAYSRLAPRGALLTEANVLRVEALVQVGRRSEAIALARQIIGQAPGSRHAARLRSLVPEADEKR